MKLLEWARQIAYKWETQRKNQRSLDSLDDYLKTNEPMLMVHQMGRAGSMSTVSTLREAGLSYPVYHTHWLNPESVKDRMERLAKLPRSEYPLNVRVGNLIAEAIQRQGLSERPWKIITIFREPVGRNVSTFFLTIETFFDNYFQRFEKGEITLDQIRGTFLSEYRHEMPLTWFDKEVKDVFGIDVYQHPFPIEQGYQILRHGQVEMLLIKLERLNDCYKAAFESFLGVEIPGLALTHITEKDPSYYMYKQFLQNACLPADYLERMYGSRFARHFYSPEEIKSFREKWSHG